MRQRSGKEESSKEATPKKSKSTISSKGTTRSPPKSSGKFVQEEKHDPRVDDLEEPFHQEFDTGNDDVSPVREATDVDERLWNPSGSRTPDQEWNLICTDIVKISRKRSKPDKHEHGNGIECARAGRMLSKSYTSSKAPIGQFPKKNDTRTRKETHQGIDFCTKRRTKEA
ncbi:hypothetical protein Tco_0863411 [Tanacetum coccineum]